MVHRTPLLALVVLLSLAPVAIAQNAGEKKSPPAKPVKTKSVKSEESEAVAAQRTLVAVTLLTALADEARSFKDQSLRARVEARAADAFWETDPEKARALFRRAWDEAEAADKEAARKQTEQLRQQEGTGGATIRRRPRDLRSEVLRLVAKRDRDLAEEFLAKLSEADERERNEATAKRNRDPEEASISIAKRIQLARRLLDDGETERAMEFATPVLDSVNRYTIFFLSALREKNAAAADQGFLSLVARAGRDSASDANTVSGLSSYAFTPFLYVAFSKDGGANISQERRDTPGPDLPQPVRTAFFRVASEILLRPLFAPDQDQTSAGRTGKYMVLKRLLPLFEQHAPEQAPILKTQMSALQSDVPSDLRSGQNRAVTHGIVPADHEQNPLARMQERLDRARTSAERDGIYADYAVDLSGKGDPKARELVDKIENATFRKSLQGYIDFSAAQQAIEKKDTVTAARLAKSGELTSTQRIWTYARAARMLMTSDQTRAVELLDEAAAEARRINGANPDRAKGLIAIATVLSQADRVRSWEITAEAVKAANASEGFTGEDSVVSATLQSPQMVLVTNATAADFDVLGLFRFLAKDDLNRSIETAKGFAGEAPRAAATLAIARLVLEKPSAESAEGS